MSVLRSQSAVELSADWILHLEAEGKKPRTLQSYRKAAREFLDFIHAQGCEYDSVSFKLLDRWRVWMLRDRKLEPRTANLEISAVKNLYHWLRWNGYIMDNPVAEVRCVKAPRLLPKPLSELDVTKLVEAARKTPFRLAYLETLYATGGRIGEFRSINVGDVDIQSREIRVLGKNDKVRILRLGRPAVEALRAWLEFRRRRGDSFGPDAPLWVGKKRGRMDLKTFRRHLREIAKDAGVEGRITPHRLRHSYATHLLNRGMKLEELQELLGHADISTTRIYTEVATGRLGAAYDQAHPRA